jgi:hypothetical protein
MLLKYIKLLPLVIIFLIMHQCVKPFMPDTVGDIGTIVIEGVITDKPGMQNVFISRTVDINSKWFDEVTGCIVQVIDDSGNIIEYNEEGNGKYSAYFSDNMLKYGRSYMLRVITSSLGEIYESGYETLIPCSKIDSIWVEIEENRNIETDPISRGYQVFLNTHGTNDNSVYYRWEMVSTWEYHAKHEPDLVKEKRPDSNYGTVTRIIPQIENDTTRVCWVTEKLGDFYVNSTEALMENSIEKVPLNFISFKAPYAKWGYSLLVKQYAMSQEAYEYYDAIYKMNFDAGGLYEIQPYKIEGNIECVSNEQEQALGFFSASGIVEKRVFIEPPEDENVYSSSCNMYAVNNLDPPITELPAYGKRVDDKLYTQERQCFNCLHMGTNKKPDFWK